MKLITAKGLSYLKVFTTGTLITGIYLHLSRLIFGMDNFQHYLFTPLFDIIFAIPMSIAGILQILFIRKIAWKNNFQKMIFYVCTVQFILSIPLHVRTLIAGNTDYVRSFPPVYSVLIIIIWCIFIYVFSTINKWQLKIRQH
ncbi:MAG: hypothetical protein ABJB11_11435 [Ferruginibacter sp.]